MVTMVPMTPIVGLKVAISGASCAPVTVKEVVVVVAEPVDVVTVIGPDSAPAGTDVTIRVAVAEIIVAGVPLNVIVFSFNVSLKPVPCMVTDVPDGPPLGVNSMIETTKELFRSTERKLLTESYEYMPVSPRGFTTALSLPRSS